MLKIDSIGREAIVHVRLHNMPISPRQIGTGASDLSLLMFGYLVATTIALLSTMEPSRKS